MCQFHSDFSDKIKSPLPRTFARAKPVSGCYIFTALSNSICSRNVTLLRCPWDATGMLRFLAPISAWKGHDYITHQPLGIRPTAVFKSCDKDLTLPHSWAIDTWSFLAMVSSFFPCLTGLQICDGLATTKQEKCWRKVIHTLRNACFLPLPIPCNTFWRPYVTFENTMANSPIPLHYIIYGRPQICNSRKCLDYRCPDLV